MKKIFFLLMMFSACMWLMAGDMTGVKIYVNPGHGGWDSNDRNVQTIPFAMGDTLGFWESKSNIIKGLHLRDLLQASGATVVMSRTLNRTQDDRSLSEIAAEANANNVDAFISIHSNAVGANTGTNYLLILFHGRDNSPKIPASLTQSQAAWTRLISNKLTVWTHYTTSTNIRGDSTFYGSYGLGVLTPLVVPGFLSEGSFHDYKPETHRLLNADYCKLEAVNLHRYYCDYFKADLPTTGIIAGHVKSGSNLINHPQYIYKAGTEDRFLPLNNARVKLMNQTGDSLAGYQIDTCYNGIFAFHNLNPGTYKLRITEATHTSKDTTVVVQAATTTFAKMQLIDPNIVVPKDTTPDFPEPNQEAGAAALNYYQFGQATPVVPEWLNQSQIRRVLYRNEKLYVLTSEPKILVINAVTTAKISEMNLTGIAGGMLPLSDIAFTADGYLLACNKDTVSLPELKGRYFKVYTWDDDNAEPKLLFQTQTQGNWANGIMGETMTVSGSRWKCQVYTTSVTSGTSKQIRIVGLSYEDGTPAVGYKYMIHTVNYTEALWGVKHRFSISPSGKDHFVIDSDKLLPQEVQFDWSKPDREPLVHKGVFANAEGFTIEPVAFGNFFFRNAGQVFMAAPVCKADSTEVGVAMFNISNGLNNAVKISDVLPAGTGTEKATFMAAAARVNGYDIDLMILAPQQGMARYRTVTPTPRANVFASELNVAMTTGIPTGYGLQFLLNDAAHVVVEVLKDSVVMLTLDGGLMQKGTNMVSFSEEQLPDGVYTWRVKATADGIDRPMKYSNNNDVQLQYYSPRGVAVDNNIGSEFFGRIYASETVPGAVTNRTTKDGIYILNAALEDFTNQGANSYAGGVTWAGASSPMRVSVGDDSRVYLTDWSDANPGVWIMDPANPFAAFKPVFSGLSVTTGLASKDGVNVHGAISHCWSTGTGDDTKLFTFDKYYVDAVATNRGNLLQYNIGTLQQPWQSPPSTIVFNDGLNGNLQQNYNSCIAPDGSGGWWISQHRSEDAASIPSLIHVKPDGSVSFNSGRTPLLIGNSNTGGMAVRPDGKQIAMGSNNEVKVYDITFDAQGAASLRQIHSIKPAMGTNTAGIAWDRAGNLYVISNSSERLGVWAMPKTENSFVTPAPASKQIYVYRSGLREPKDLSKQFKVYPNPVRDLLMVESKAVVINKVELFDLEGRLIIGENSNDNKLEINTSTLSRGTYILRISTDEGVHSQRIMKR